MKIYCVQFDIAWENKAQNFARVETLLTQAHPEPGSLVLLPEMFATGFSMNVATIEEGPGGETERFLSGAAKNFRAFLLAGVVTKGSDGRARNQSLVINPEGRELARYSKMQPFTPGGETQHYAAGVAPLLFDWQGWAVSPFICYDLRFPEHFRTATRLGAQLLTVIASWPVARIQHWVTLLQARAIENQCYVAGVNRCGSDPQLRFSGRSIIVSPKGEILADAADGEGVISAEVSLDELKAYRKELPFLADMRI